MALDVRSRPEEEFQPDPSGRFVVALRRGGDSLLQSAVVPAKLSTVHGERSGTRHSLRPESERTIRPDVNLPDVADRASLDVFHRAPVVVPGMPLVAHLREY